jgi:hypothetical protein
MLKVKRQPRYRAICIAWEKTNPTAKKQQGFHQFLRWNPYFLLRKVKRQRRPTSSLNLATMFILCRNIRFPKPRCRAIASRGNHQPQQIA